MTKEINEQLIADMAKDIISVDPMADTGLRELGLIIDIMKENRNEHTQTNTSNS